MNNHKLSEMSHYLGQPRLSKTEPSKGENNTRSSTHVQQHNNNTSQVSNKGMTEKLKKGTQPQEASLPKSPSLDKLDPNSKGDTTEFDDRRAKFLQNYQEFKTIKHQAAERKRKWLKWQKTEWKYTLLSKQPDFFSDSSDEEALDQASLADESSLKFLENRITVSMKRKEINKNKAIERKNAGNNFISKKDYQNAVKCYSEGIECIKDMKELYTNRALAYLKLNEYQKAIQDCTRILEFVECFEGNFIQSSSICIKVLFYFQYKAIDKYIVYLQAFLRRAQSYKELGQYEESCQDIEQVFKLSPNDKDAQKIKDEIESLIELQKQQQQDLKISIQTNTSSSTSKASDQNQTLQDQSNIILDPKILVQKIQMFLTQKKPDHETTEFLISVFKSSEQLRIFAYQQNIISRFILMFQNYPFNYNLYFLFITFIKGSPQYQRDFLRLDGANILFKLLTDLSSRIITDTTEAEKMRKNIQISEEIGQILEVFINFTETESSADIFKSQQFIPNLMNLLYKKLMTFIRFDISALTSLLGLILNLIAVSNECLAHIRDNFLGHILTDSVSIILQVSHTSFLKLKGNLYGIIASMLKDEKARTRLLCSVDDFLKFLLLTLDNIQLLSISNPSNLRWISSVEGALALFINIALNSSSEELQIVLGDSLGLFGHFKKFLSLSQDRQAFHKVILRTLQLLSKTEYNESYFADTRNDILYSLRIHLDVKGRMLGHANHALRFYIRWFDKRFTNTILKSYKTEDFGDLINNLHETFREDDVERLTNGCILAANVIELYPILSEKFKDDINVLLEIVKAKTGNDKKNAAILLSKLSKNSKNLHVITESNGMQILASVKNKISGKP